MCLYICSRPFNAKNVTFKELLMWQRRCGGKWSIGTSQIHWSVFKMFLFFFFYWISTLSRDSWAPVTSYALWAQWGEALASTLRSLTHGNIEKYSAALSDEMRLYERSAEHHKLLLFSLFPAVFHRHLFIHSVVVLHPNMTAGVCMGPEC